MSKRAIAAALVVGIGVTLTGCSSDADVLVPNVDRP